MIVAKQVKAARVMLHVTTARTAAGNIGCGDGTVS
jgi:hypothetical protein